MSDRKHIVILGGYGTFGRLISEALAKEPRAFVIITGRNQQKGLLFAETIGVQYKYCDANNTESLRQLFTSAYLIINAVGPFQEADYTIPNIAIECNCHYIDIGDGRAYVTNISNLHDEAKEKNCFVCVGASTSPAITTALATELQPQFSHIDTIKVALTAGNKNEAGASTINSILSYTGKPINVWYQGRWQQLLGWRASEFVEYPQPVGRRKVQLCDLPDLTLMPQLFEAETMFFKAGLELNLFNYGLFGLSWLRQIVPDISLSFLTPLLMRISKLFKPFGTFAGGVAVWASGTKDGKSIKKSLFIIAKNDGPQVPISPAVLLARKLLNQTTLEYGAFPCTGFLTLKEIEEHLKSFGIQIIHGESKV